MVQNNWDNAPHNPSENIFEKLLETISIKYFSYEQNGHVMPIPISAKEMDQDEFGKVTIIKSSIKHFPISFLISSHHD